MKTRGKGKTDVGITNYAKDTLDPRDFGDDGEDTNGYSEDRGDDVAQSRSDARSARNAGNRRGGRIPRAGNTRTKTDKSIMESAEFQDVVKGFFDFIEEIKRKKKKDPKNGRDPKPVKISEDPAPGKRPKLDTQTLQSQPAGKSELQSEDIGLDKTDKNHYSFKQDIHARKDLLDMIRDKEPANVFPPPLQPQDLDVRAKEATKQKDPPMNKLGFPGTNYLPSANLPSLNNPPKQQLNKSLQNLYFDNPALFQDRLPLQNFADQNLLRSYYMSPYDNYPYGLNSNQLLNYQLLEALLQKSQPELLASLLESQNNDPYYDLQRQLQPSYTRSTPLGLGSLRFGNQPLGARLVENEPEVLNPKGFEGKLGRAATHVAIAYFIYFKSLDPDTIAKADKTKMDPTYNARMLKEKRTEPYPNEIPSMLGKLGPYYSGLPIENSFQPNTMEYLERRLMEGQRFLRDQGMPAGYQGKNEPKVEEELPKKKTSEAREAARQAAKQKPPKEEDIIQIEENSDVEPEKPPQSNQKPETKVNPPEIKTQPTKSDQTIRAEPSKKLDENIGNVSAEDIVQEIAELTGHSGSGDGDKRKNTRRPPSKSASEENTKPPSQGPVSQKVYAVGDESELPVAHTDVKNEIKGNQPKNGEKGIQVISSDESPSQKETEQKEQVTENKEEKQQETKPESATASVNEKNENPDQNP